MSDEKYERYFKRVRYDKTKNVNSKGECKNDLLTGSMAIMNKSSKRLGTLEPEDDRSGLVNGNYNTYRGDKDEILLGSDKNMLQIKPKTG